VSAVTAVSLDRVTTLALERFQGETYRPGVEGDTPLRSTWNGVKLTRRVAPGTTVSVLQLTGDAMATGFSAGHGLSWGSWEADVGLWVSSDTAHMGLDTSYAGFDGSISRDVGHGLRVGVGVSGSLVRGQLAALTLQYAAPDNRTNATLALRQWYGAATLLELRGWRRLGRGWQLGAVATTQPTLSLSIKQRL
jgi:hypothetical protein